MATPIDIPPEGPQPSGDRLGTRLLIALGLGLLVAFLAFVVAWQGLRDEMYFKGHQFMTRIFLRSLNEDIRAYQRKTGSLPHSLEQLRQLKDTSFRFRDDRPIVDAWEHPFSYSVKGNEYVLLSHGRDGKEGGVGLDCDLTSTNLRPAESRMTFGQFTSAAVKVEPIMVACFASGLVTFLLSMITIKPKDLERKRLAARLLTLAGMAVATVIAAIGISALHLSGH